MSSSPIEITPGPNKRQKVALGTSNDDMQAELAAALGEAAQKEAEWVAAREAMWDAIERADEVRKRIQPSLIRSYTLARIRCPMY